MALDPYETDPVLAVDGQETDPEIGIEPLFKVLALPAEDPALIDRVDYILGVAVDDDFRIGTLDRLESGDDGCEFHTVVGSLGEAGRKFLVMLPAAQDDTVTARPGIAPGRAVSENLYRQQFPFSTHFPLH